MGFVLSGILVLSGAMKLRIFIIISSGFMAGLTILAGKEFDSVDWALGGLRGQVVAPATDKYPFQTEGTTVKLIDGTLVHAFNLRFGEEDMSNWHAHYARTVIGKVESKDGGKTWSEPEVMFESNTGINASHPAIRRLPNGELGATYQRINTKPVDQWDRKNWLNSLTNSDKIFRYSKDEGKTWSKEILISPPTGYWTSGHDRLLVHSSGRLIQPLHTQVNFDIGRHDVVATKVAWSDNYGRTWHLGKQLLEVRKLATGYTNIRISNFHEVAIAERADGSIYMIGRTSAGRLYQSESFDRGETWTTPNPTDLYSSEAPPNIERIPGSDDILLLWNSQSVFNTNSALGHRLTLASMITSDGGKSWKHYREFITIPAYKIGSKNFSQNGVSYPSIFFDEGWAHIGYWGRATIEGKTYDQQYMAAVPISYFYSLEEHDPTSVD
jgi:hypothetical protein